METCEAFGVLRPAYIYCLSDPDTGEIRTRAMHARRRAMAFDCMCQI